MRKIGMKKVRLARLKNLLIDFQRNYKLDSTTEFVWIEGLIKQVMEKQAEASE